IQRADSLHALWYEVTYRLSVAYENGETDLIDRIYAYADWCLWSQCRDISSAAAVGFYAQISSDPLMRADIPNRFSLAQFESLKVLFAYLLDEKDFAELEAKVREADKSRDECKRHEE